MGTFNGVPAPPAKSASRLRATMTGVAERKPLQTRGGLRQRLWNALGPYGFLVPKLVFFFAFMCVPLGWAVFLSLQAGPYPGMHGAGLSNFAALLGDDTFWTALTNSITYAILIIPISLALALLIAGLLNRQIRFRPVFWAFLILPAITSAAAASVAWAYLLQTDGGFVNGVLGAVGIAPVNWLGTPGLSRLVVVAIEIWRGSPFYAVILLAGMQSIPQHLYDAGAVDGVVGIRAFWSITLPLLRPVLLFVVVMASIWNLQIFDIPFIVTQGGPAGTSISLAQYIYQTAFGNDDIGLASAMALVLLVVTMGLALIELWAFRRDVEF